MVAMTKKFLPSTQFLMFASQLEGTKIAQMATVPYAISGQKRQWGKQIDSWPKRDPAGVFVMCENRGLPVLYNEDCIYNLTVT